MMTVLAQNLKRFRLAKNMTQEQAAQTLGVSTQSVSRWECGTTLPDVMLLPRIAQLYCVTIDDLYRQSGTAYDNYAQRLGSVFEFSRRPEDFLQAELEYRRMLQSGQYTPEDLRLYGVLYQQMMQLCAGKAEEMYDRVLKRGPAEDPEIYWRTRRQKGYLLWQLGRNGENIREFLPLVEAGSRELEDWICLIQAYSFAGDHENAWHWVQKAQARFPESAVLHMYTGDLLREMKQYDGAFEHWKRAKELEPEWCDADYAMASCYEELGDYESAARVYSGIAASLAERGFDAEVNLPRALAQQCREKAEQ